MQAISDLIKAMVDKIDNDTVIIVGLIMLGIVYAASNTGEQTVGNIVSGFVGYLGGQYKLSNDS
jgi:hypothetical protein